jgi:hypothetical protein
MATVLQTWRSMSQAQKFNFLVFVGLITALGLTATGTVTIYAARKETLGKESWGIGKKGQTCTAYCATQCTGGRCLNKRMKWVKSRAMFRQINMTLGKKRADCYGLPIPDGAVHAPRIKTKSKECWYSLRVDKSFDYCGETPGTNVRHMCACDCKE